MCLANRLPLQIADMTVHDVATFATIELDMVLVTTLDTEEEILHMKKCTEACAKKLADLIGTLAAAAKDLESLIEKNTTKAAERDEKAKQAAELKQHRALLREDEKKQKAAKADAKKTGSVMPSHSLGHWFRGSRTHVSL